MSLLGGGKRALVVLFISSVMHCYTTPEAVEDEGNLARLGAFCRLMGRETNQGEIGLMIADECFAIRDYGEMQP